MYDKAVKYTTSGIGKWIFHLAKFSVWFFILIINKTIIYVLAYLNLLKY